MNHSAHQLSLRLLQHCPSCKAGLSESNINILSETENHLLIHLTCSQCHANHLTHIIQQAQGLMGNAIVTDLSYQETLRCMRNESMTEDAFLELYRAIHQEDFMYRVFTNVTK